MPNIVFVDGIRPNAPLYHHGKAGELRTGLIPHVLPQITPLDWRERRSWLVHPDIILVLLFANNDSVCETLKFMYPDANVIAWVDPGADVLLTRWGTMQQNMVRDLAYCDAIGTWDPSLQHGKFLSMLVPEGKPVIDIPIPLIPGNEHLRDTPKRNLIMGVLHRQDPRRPEPTLAVCQALARDTGYDVVYFDDHHANSDTRKQFAPLAFTVPTFEAAYNLLPACKLMVDLYTIRHYGRMATHAANVGTMSITSPWCAKVGHFNVDPWSDMAYHLSLHALTSDCSIELEAGYTILKHRHNPTRIFQQICKGTNS